MNDQPHPINRREFIRIGSEAFVLGTGLLTLGAAARPESSLMNLLAESRRRLLDAPDTICLERARLVTEAWREHEALPGPLRQARVFEHVLRHMSLDLETCPILAGNTSSRPRAWMLLPEWGMKVPEQALEEIPGIAGFLDRPVTSSGQAAADPIPEDIRAFWAGRSMGGGHGIGHLTIRADRLLSKGLNAVIAEAEHPASGHAAGEAAEQAEYRQACAIACRAVVEWAGRYADAAGAAAQTESDPLRRACLKRVSAACRRVPAEPARDLFEALQSLTLVHHAMHIEGHGYSVSPGRLDQLLAPYYHGQAEATVLIAAFLLKCASVSTYGRHSMTQAITVGGVDSEGRDRCNPLTLATLDACELIRLPDPVLYLRWHRAIDPAVKRKAVAMLTVGHSMPILVGDVQTAAGLIGAGVAPEDAWNYCVIGCNELGIPGRLIFDSVVLPEAALLREVLLDEQGRDGLTDMDHLLDRLVELAAAHLRRQLTGKMRHTPHMARQRPTPFTSALMDDCLAKGCDLLTGLRYPYVNVRSSGFTNCVDGLAALHQVVYERRQATLEEVAAALENDFANHGPLQTLLRRAPKWGHDDPAADHWGQAWLERRTALVAALRNELNTQPLLMELVVRSLHRVDGKMVGATPDGRHAGQPLGDSIGAPGGVSPAGPTAILNTVRRVEPSRHWPGGYNLNLTLPAMPGGQADPEILAKITAMVEAFFAGGGQELQVAALSADRLREARAHPDRHPDLMVRIAGFNAFYTRLAAGEQEEILNRALGVAAPAA